MTQAEVGQRGQARVIVLFIAMIFIMPVSLVITGTEPSEMPITHDITEVNFYEGNTQIQLAAAQFDINVGPQNLDSRLCINEYDSRVDGYYIVQFDGPVKQMWKAQLHQIGAHIGSYVPYNAFVFKMSEKVKDQVENHEHVQYVGIYQPAYKLPPELAGDLPFREGLNVADSLDIINYQTLWEKAKVIGEGVKRTVSITLHENENPYNVAALIGKTGGKIIDISETANLVRAEVSEQGIQALAYVNEVEFVMPYFNPEPKLATANVWEQTKVAGQTPVWDAWIRTM